ncbi:Methylated-DNA--protein-cysteine methyltransferase, constitutive [Aquicella siphonis]|uniref:Methylated-DNA--protein-cysteine methyltransferase, constitutive n=1 Tax=Aquicella siphonis TaxID=254247 RepID=A0A5E4PIN1_9COXI|nr:methylated-DNA--[protein]-cysteine S-methyltransferase [Aquicella siphonis]VVC76287.1 Methylated-DNA--protein-cysteine methyltransferase, constitutive [Aquicella siphonis]
MTRQISYDAIAAFPIGKIGIKLHQEKLAALDYLPDDTLLLSPRNTVSQQVVDQLEQYFAGSRLSFALDIHFHGSAFQQRVWHALMEIPFGRTMTYGELAKTLKTGPRAIGQACRTNLIPVVIPCHRIIAANHPGGYSGSVEGKLMNIKMWLLQHETV